MTTPLRHGFTDADVDTRFHAIELPVLPSVQQIAREARDSTTRATEEQSLEAEVLLLRERLSSFEADFLKVRRSLTGSIHSTDDLRDVADSLVLEVERLRAAEEGRESTPEEREELTVIIYAVMPFGSRATADKIARAILAAGYRRVPAPRATEPSVSAEMVHAAIVSLVSSTGVPATMNTEGKCVGLMSAVRLKGGMMREALRAALGATEPTPTDTEAE